MAEKDNTKTNPFDLSELSKIMAEVNKKSQNITFKNII